MDNRQPLAVETLSLELRREEKEIWPGVDLERALFLTREYLFDAFRLRSDRPRRYDWHVHALGLLVPEAGWIPTDELTLHELYDLGNRAVAKRFEDPVERDRYGLKGVQKLAPGDAAWTATIRQDCALADPSLSVLGRAWYERQIGVRIHMLGEPGTTVFAGRSPESRREPGREKNKGEGSELPNEVGGTTLLVRREMPQTVFAALHEPFERNAPRIESVRRIGETAEGLAVSVKGKPGSGVDDRILYAFWDHHLKPITLASDGESFTFVDRAFLRVGLEKVEVSGDLRRLRLRVAGRPSLTVNGRPAPAAVAGGWLTFGE